MITVNTTVPRHIAPFLLSENCDNTEVNRVLSESCPNPWYRLLDVKYNEKVSGSHVYCKMEYEPMVDLVHVPDEAYRILTKKIKDWIRDQAEDAEENQFSMSFDGDNWEMWYEHDDYTLSVSGTAYYRYSEEPETRDHPGSWDEEFVITLTRFDCTGPDGEKVRCDFNMKAIN